MTNVRKHIREKEKENDRKYKRKLGRYKLALRLLILLAVLVVVIGAYTLKDYLDNRIYSDCEVVRSFELEDGADNQYFDFGSYLLKYNSDGIAYLNADKVLWTQPFEIRNPTVDICGDYVVIGEKKSNLVYLCDVAGNRSKITTSYPIINLKVSKQGVVVAVLEDGHVNYIEVTDREGNTLATGRTSLSGNGYPIDVSISNDGTKMVVSYIHVNSVTQTKLVFYNFGEVGKNEFDRIVGGFHYDGTIVPEVKFIDNDTVCVFGDDKFAIYSMKQIPEKIYEEDYAMEIKSVFYNSNYIGIVSKNDTGGQAYLLTVYNKKGKKLLKKNFDMEYNGIKFANNNVLLYNDNMCELISIKGVSKFESTFENGIAYMAPISGSDRFLLVNNISIDEIRLK